MGGLPPSVADAPAVEEVRSPDDTPENLEGWFNYFEGARDADEKLGAHEARIAKRRGIGAEREAHEPTDLEYWANRRDEKTRRREEFTQRLSNGASMYQRDEWEDVDGDDNDDDMFAETHASVQPRSSGASTARHAQDDDDDDDTDDDTSPSRRPGTQ